ncbi:MAG TPA: Rrf2 family transcriptional regulator [Caulobacteraceae bacterium]|jgi:Rrf2 family protein
MRLNEGVEWAAHACAVLAALPQGRGLTAATLAAFHELPPSYMAKQLQALAKAGVVTSLRGARGGYRLARRPSDISLWEVAAAIEGEDRGFRCSEIRRKGPCASSPQSCKTPCAVAASFWAAEDAYRESLRRCTVADIVREVLKGSDEAYGRRFSAWLATALG